MLHAAVAAAMNDEGWRLGQAIKLVSELGLDVNASYRYDAAGARVMYQLDEMIDLSNERRSNAQIMEGMNAHHPPPQT